MAPLSLVDLDVVPLLGAPCPPRTSAVLGCVATSPILTGDITHPSFSSGLRGMWVRTFEGFIKFSPFQIFFIHGENNTVIYIAD